MDWRESRSDFGAQMPQESSSEDPMEAVVSLVTPSRWFRFEA
jgi:hypothetical protein